MANARQSYKQYEMYSLEHVNKTEKLLPQMTDSGKRHRAYCKAYYDTDYLMDTFFSHWKTHRGKKIEGCPLHQDIDKAYASCKDVNLVAPRGHAKTTRVLINIFKDLVYGEEMIGEPYDLLYLSSKGLGEISIGRLRLELENNKKIREVYGVLCPNDEDTKYIQQNRNKKWKQSYLELTNGASIETVSKGGSLRGRRKHKVIVDDPEENKDVRNKRTVEEFRDFIFTTVYNMMLPGGNMFVMGTIVGEMCLVEHLRKRKGWITIIRKAIKNGKPIRPALWSKKALKKRLEVIGTARFLQEFMHIPISRKDRVVKEHWIRYHTGPLPKFDYTIIGIDIATTEKKKSDETSMCKIGVVEKRNEQGQKILYKYVIRSAGWKLTPGKNELMIVKTYLERGGATHVLYEANIEAKLLEDLKKRGLPIQGVKQSKDKHTRLLDEAPDIEFGRVFFLLGPEQKELIYQLTHFPDVEHDDRMDACLIALKGGVVKVNRKVVRA